jgi:hypothetical protein
MRLIHICWFVLLISPGVQAGEAASSAEALLSVAEQKYQQSKDLGFAWRSTRQAIAKGQSALATGDFESALSQAQSAIALAEASIAQAQREAVDWQRRAPFNND